MRLTVWQMSLKKDRNMFHFTSPEKLSSRLAQIANNLYPLVYVCVDAKLSLVEVSPKISTIFDGNSQILRYSDPQIFKSSNFQILIPSHAPVTRPSKQISTSANSLILYIKELPEAS